MECHTPGGTRTHAVRFALSGEVDPARVVNASTVTLTRSTAAAFVERNSVSPVEFTVNGVEPSVAHFDESATDPCSRIVAAVDAFVADVVALNAATVNSRNACGNRKSVPPPVVFFALRLFSGPGTA